MGGVPGEWIRPRNGRSGGTILYLHGGGYVGTSPRMYSVFAAWLARRTGCDVFLPDLRLAPEFPFPADLEDAAAVVRGLLASGIAPERLVLAGDSSGGGLVDHAGGLRHRDREAAGGRGRPLLPRGDAAARPPRRCATTPASTSCPGTSRPSAYLHGVDPASPLGVSGHAGPRRLAADVRVRRWGRDVPGRHPQVLGPPRGGRRGCRGARGAGDVPRLPDPDAVVGRRPPHRSPRRGRSSAVGSASVDRGRGGTGPDRCRHDASAISHLGICVADLDRSLRFYCECPGLRRGGRP